MNKIIGTLVFTGAFFIAANIANCVAAEADADAATAVTSSLAPSIQYQSPFKDYRPLGEDKRIPWKAANDEVGKIGGWRVYAREASVDNAAKESMPPQPPGKPVTKPGIVASPGSTPADKLAEEPAVKSTVKPVPMDHTDHAGHGQPK